MKSEVRATTSERRWRPTYGLMSLFVAFTFAICIAALAGVKVRQVARQRHAVDVIRSHGGWVYYDDDLTGGHIGTEGNWDETFQEAPDVPQWALDAIGPDYFRKVIVVSFEGWSFESDHDDAVMSVIANLPHVEGIELAPHPNMRCVGCVPITDAGIEYLAAMPNLKLLSARNTQITDKGLEALGRCNQLVELDLDYTAVTDDGLKHLARLSNLRSLSLNETRVTDRGIETLSALQSLQGVSVIDTAVTDKACEKLRAALPKCGIWNRPPFSGGGSTRIQPVDE